MIKPDYKTLKDPIYGYIYIPRNYMDDIVDTSPFQRLRRIIQTSYSPLFASAVHNRFVHSLGVFHLGEIAVNEIVRQLPLKLEMYENKLFGIAEDKLSDSQKDQKEIEEKKIKDILELLGVNDLKEIFELACLLHDVGHAPFSHTGEQFYLTDKLEYTELHLQMCNLVGSVELVKDVQERAVAANPHEIMSVIVGLKEYSDFFDSIEKKVFFARCITGYKYTYKQEDNDIVNIVKSIKNCFVDILNGKIIDVDKLDYLIRDAYTTGYYTVKIDYERLLKYLTIFKEDSVYRIGYYKGALSVIEHVVYAHDSEKRWLQNHPVVLYENYILGRIMDNINKNFRENDENKLFSLDSLSREGHKIRDRHTRLLSDDDIIDLMKNVYYNEYSNEYFERNQRRHAIWKSDAEYNYRFQKIVDRQVAIKLEETLENVIAFLKKETNDFVLNERIIEKLENEIESVNNIPDSDMSLEAKKQNIVEKQSILNVIKVFRELATAHEIEFDFVILMTSRFNSGFSKPDFKDIDIIFTRDKGEDSDKFVDCASSFQAKEDDSENKRKIYYIYYRRKKEKTTTFDLTQTITQLLTNAFIETIKQ